jgi:hypothetical protein
LENLKCKFNCTFVIGKVCVVWWRHVVLKVGTSCQGNSATLGGVRHSVVEHVNYNKILPTRDKMTAYIR